MTYVKSHKRTRKNGVTIVRKHKRELTALEQYFADKDSKKPMKFIRAQGNTQRNMQHDMQQKWFDEGERNKNRAAAEATAREQSAKAKKVAPLKPYYAVKDSAITKLRKRVKKAVGAIKEIFVPAHTRNGKTVHSYTRQT